MVLVFLLLAAMIGIIMFACCTAAHDEDVRIGAEDYDCHKNGN